MRRERLANGADVVALALDREERRAPDRRRFHRLAAPGELAAREERLLEHDAHRLEIELGGQIEHGKVLVVEIADRLRLLDLAGGKVLCSWMCERMWRSAFIDMKAASWTNPG